jgi:hypothetical protein
MHMHNLMSYNHINQYALLHKFFCVNKTADNSFSTFYYYVFEILCHGKKKWQAIQRFVDCLINLLF